MNRPSLRPTLATIRSDEHPRLDTRQHADGISVTPTVGMLLTEVICEDGRRTCILVHILYGKVAGLRRSIRYIRGNVISFTVTLILTNSIFLPTNSNVNELEIELIVPISD